MKLKLAAAAVLAVLLCTGCSVFETEQERSGVNPKPFNSQTSWETNPYGAFAN